METITVIYAVMIFLAGISFSFFIGYQTGYLRYSVMYQDALDKLTEIVTKEKKVTAKDKIQFPKQLNCEHCDDERKNNSISDCLGCGTTCCDLCYEDYHTGGPCEPPKLSTGVVLR